MGFMHALILAGGKGERLRPLTDTLPKPMVPVCGKPILQRQVEWLKEGSVDGVVFLAGYLWETIRDYFGDGSGFGISAEYSIEDSPLGRGGAIKQGYPLAPPSGEPVVVTNGDIITRQPLAEILEFHRNSPARENGPSVTLLSVPMVSPYGIVDMDGDGRVVGFREKVELPHWINGGVYVFDREVFSEFPDLGDHEVETFPRLAQEGRIAAYQTRSFWTSIDSFKDLREAEQYLSREGVAP
jgi:NDP-sugar pyrophosphorylase family protein